MLTTNHIFKRSNSLIWLVIAIILVFLSILSFLSPVSVEEWIKVMCDEANQTAGDQIRDEYIHAVNRTRRMAENMPQTGIAAEDLSLTGNLLYCLTLNEEGNPMSGVYHPEYGAAIREGLDDLNNGKELGMGFLNLVGNKICFWILIPGNKAYVWAAYDWTNTLHSLVGNKIDETLLFFDGELAYSSTGVEPKEFYYDIQTNTPTNKQGGKTYILSLNTINKKFQLYTFIRFDLIYKLSKTYGIGFGVLFSLLSIASFGMWVKVKRYHKREILEMQILSEQCKTMDLFEKIQFDETNEFAPFYNIINSLTARMNSLVNKNRELSDCRRNIEIRQLQGQFNPHFVFNLLANLQYLIQSDPEKAGLVVTNLSKLLRYSIQSGRTKVRLEVDIQHMESYLMLQKSRYGARLQYSFTVSPDLMVCEIPKLLIQPLIENAIVHNIDKVDILKIQISAAKDEDIIEISVSDNGQGIPPAELAKLIGALENGNPEGQQIGLFNVHRTVQLEFGEEYGAKIDSVYGHGTILSVCFPAREHS